MFSVLFKILVFFSGVFFCVAWLVDFIEGGAIDADFYEIDSK